jgi:hypothetical protein
MAPIVHGLEAEYFDKINFVYLDIDDPANDNFKQLLGFRYQPQFFLIDSDGNIIQQWVGAVPETDFRTAFDQTYSP